VHIDLDDRPLSERVADRIEQMIFANEINPGDKIPNEYELMKSLNIGRGTIREAIKILASRNVLEIKRGYGTYVCEKVGQIEDPLGFRFIQDKKKLALDLVEIRMMLEPEIAAAAAINSTPEQVVVIQDLCNKVSELISKKEDYGKADMEFHNQIAFSTGNQVISRVIPIINSGIELFVDITKHSKAGRANITHQAVTDAIRDHDPNGARQAMKAHLQDNKETLLTL
jgi:DNA-binding FadR family transcriptional regulator